MNLNPEFEFEFRELCGINELSEAESLQKTVWDSDDDFEKRDILLAVQHAGGLVGGAFLPSGQMVGFVFAFPAIQPHRFHSHRLAVLPQWRNHHLGEKLKWYQRDWCLERKVELIQWTFDPLRAINADLNIRRLGATSSTYFEDYYGEMSGINAGAPSDRILVDWVISSPKVAALSNNSQSHHELAEIVTINPIRNNIPGEENINLEAQALRVNIPVNFGQLLIEDRSLALVWRSHTRRIFKHYFSRGYHISQFTREGGPAYVLEKNQELSK